MDTREEGESNGDSLYRVHFLKLGMISILPFLVVTAVGSSLEADSQIIWETAGLFKSIHLNCDYSAVPNSSNNSSVYVRCVRLPGC